VSFQDYRILAQTRKLRTGPSFLVVRQRPFGGWLELLRTLCSSTPSRPSTAPITLFRYTTMAKLRFAGRPLTLSVLLHVAGFLWLPYMPTLNSRTVAPVETASAETGKVYYHLTMMDLTEKFPRIAPAGPGGHPGDGLGPAQLPDLGSTVPHPKITIVLRPPRPNHPKQTVHQFVSAPDLSMDMDLKLPNLIAAAAAVPRPHLRFTPFGPVSLKPNDAKKGVPAEPAPNLISSPSASVMPLSEVTGAEPPPPPYPAPDTATSSHETLTLADGAPRISSDTSALLTLSNDPSPAASLLALPPGNQWAELSIASTAGGAGSPGGTLYGAPSTGRERSGTGGDASTGVGRAESGGGVGNAQPNEVLSVNTGSGGTTNNSDPMFPANLVYALPDFVQPRKNALVVSAGPMGGGGLDSYGALHCGRIYTVFLPMPGKSWTLQFCEAKHDLSTNTTGNRSRVVQLESSLLPPDAELRFDFQRLSLPPGSAHKLILLRGLIREDGTVDLVKVYRGLLPPMDQAAQLAFSRWKFKPAMREGHPVSVEVLVGIPSEEPVLRGVR
jgi:Gram-negative bacterial TonB protein C-terminal